MKMKLKIYLEDGSYFWADLNKNSIKTIFNKETYYLIEKDEYNLKFKNSLGETLDLKISKGNNRDILRILDDFCNDEDEI